MFVNFFYSSSINLSFKALSLRIVSNLISIFNSIVKRHFRKIFIAFVRFFNNIIQIFRE